MNEAVFLVDVDNTLLDNDRIRDDIQRDFEAAYGTQSRDRYWTIQERLFVELGYRDYLGALQIYRKEHPDDMRVLSMAAYLIDYPFGDRVYPGVLAVLARLREWGTAVILTDGDAVFQPRKVERAGLAQAVGGNVLVYVHKEAALADIERHYPARHYVVVDDKLRLLDAIKRSWAKRVTTVFVRQGAFAQDAAALASLQPADLSIEHIADLLAYDLAALIAAARPASR
jgi:FMN phosphatase YigB (HAD superfamily)